METQLINGDDEKINESALDDNSQDGDASIAVVAIMGPQSSGKSTVLNHLFGTNFAVMNEEVGRSQTTKGIWIAKAQNMEPATMVLDLEGSDAQERGEENTFEKQSALFTLAVADTVIINMWCNDIGRENAANRPLLRTIFEAMLSFLNQKTTDLIFVVRDKPERTPPDLLELRLNEDVHQIWEAVPKPRGQEHTDFTQIFNVKVTVLSHYEYRRADFDQEVEKLKLEIVSSHQQRDNRNCPTLSIFLKSAKATWDMIKENKDLKVPPIRVMVATMRCEEIVYRQLELLKSDQAWLELQRNAKTHLVQDFGKRTSSILEDCLSNYDEEAMNFEENVKKVKRQFLMSEALQVVHPAYKHTLGHIRSKAIQSFKTQLQEILNLPDEKETKFYESKVRECRDSVLQFTQQCSEYAAIKQANWKDDVSTAHQGLLHEIRVHALYQLKERLSNILTREMLKVKENPEGVWGNIRSRIKSESERAESATVDIFGVEKEDAGQIVAELKEHAANRVKTNFEGQSRDDVLNLMNQKFFAVVGLDKSISPSVKKEAYCQSLDVLSTMAVIRLDEEYDHVRELLHSGLIDGDETSTYSLSSDTWEEVPAEKTLITPIACRDIWYKFKRDMERYHAKSKEMEKKKGWWQSLPSGNFLWALLTCGTVGLYGLALWFPPAALVLRRAAMLLATMAGAAILQGAEYRYSDTNEIIDLDAVLNNPRIRAILDNNLHELHASLISA